jgi:SPP1 gp7 family putative phage head morphogenesis protein
MPVNQKNLARAVRLIGREHARVVIRLATRQDKLENKWQAEVMELHKGVLHALGESITSKGTIDIPRKPFIEFFLRHYIETAGLAMDSYHDEMEVVLPEEKRLARLPLSFKQIRQIYDRYRTTGKVPKALKKQADKLRDLYLNKVQSVWKKYSEDFRAGDEFNQHNVLRKIKDAADVVQSRAQTIVRTSTTNFYNDTRREIYDQSDAVTHYLFLAIRDQGTTVWCTDKVVRGKRGRHGLVYDKSDPITQKETPACHWNCRSEMVPLSPYNPRHLRLIQDESLWRRNNVCHPLPPGWAA